MTDLSTSEPVTKWSEQWWADASPQIQAGRCTAHRKNGDRCRNASISGAVICRVHGANKNVRRKARERIENAADKMARLLLEMASDTSVPESVRLSAIRDSLDRAGLRPPTEIAVSSGPRAYEQIFDDIAGGSRAESRRARGYVDDPDRETFALDAPAGDDTNRAHTPAATPIEDSPEIVDAELVEENPSRTGSEVDSEGCNGPEADVKVWVDNGHQGDSSKNDHRRSPIYPPITGEDAIHEAARVNRLLGVWDEPRALGPGLRR